MNLVVVLEKKKTLMKIWLRYLRLISRARSLGSIEGDEMGTL